MWATHYSFRAVTYWRLSKAKQQMTVVREEPEVIVIGHWPLGLGTLRLREKLGNLNKKS